MDVCIIKTKLELFACAVMSSLNNADYVRASAGRQKFKVRKLKLKKVGGEMLICDSVRFRLNCP